MLTIGVNDTVPITGEWHCLSSPCGALAPSTWNRCTRPVDHDGRHVAVTTGMFDWPASSEHTGRVLEVWLPRMNECPFSPSGNHCPGSANPSKCQFCGASL